MAEGSPRRQYPSEALLEARALTVLARRVAEQSASMHCEASRMLDRVRSAREHFRKSRQELLCVIYEVRELRDPKTRKRAAQKRG
jgi:hypothetical protein